MNRRNTLALTCFFATITLLGMTWGLAQTPPGTGGPGLGGGYEAGTYGEEVYGSPAGGGMLGGIAPGGLGMGGQIYDPYAHHELAAPLQPVLQRLRDAADDEQKKAIKAELSKILADYFDRDLKWRANEIQSIEQRVDRLRTQLEQRQQAKDEILQLQLKVLENEAAGLGFFGQRPGPGGMADGTMMGMEGAYGDQGFDPMGGMYPGGMGSGTAAPVPQAFQKRIEVDFVETPLNEAMDYLREMTKANIYVDQLALKEASIDSATPVNMTLKDVSVATVLELITYELSGSFGVRYEDGIAMIGSHTDPPLAQRFPWGNDNAPSSQQTEKLLANSTANFEFVETPLSEVLDFFKDATGANIILNHRSLSERDIMSDTPVTLSLKDVKPRTALRLILDSVDKSLFFCVVDGVVVVSATPS